MSHVKEGRKKIERGWEWEKLLLSLQDVIASNFPSGWCGFKWVLMVKSSQIPQCCCLCPAAVRFSQILRAASWTTGVLYVQHSSAAGNKGTLEESHCIHKLKDTVFTVRKLAVIIVIGVWIRLKWGPVLFLTTHLNVLQMMKQYPKPGVPYLRLKN